MWEGDIISKLKQLRKEHRYMKLNVKAKELCKSNLTSLYSLHSTVLVPYFLRWLDLCSIWRILMSLGIKLNRY